MFGMIIGKRVILREWKAITPPCYNKWLNDLMLCLYLEEIQYKPSENHEKFEKIWGPLVDIIKKKTARSDT